MIMGRSSSFWGARVMLRIWENEEGGVRKRKELDIYIYIPGTSNGNGHPLAPKLIGHPSGLCLFLMWVGTNSQGE